MTLLTEAFAAILEKVQRPGDFFATGTLELHLPRLEVQGVGPVALPLLPAQAEAIIAVADQAPYGRGTETVVDTAVRRTWQVGAERVRITGKGWSDAFSAMVAKVAAGLGVSGPVEASLYKLLVYDTGSFFVRHRDSEKAPGMFATLVLVLPSEYSGGELVVRHGGREARLDLRREEPSEAAFAAFYADCVHEVRPIHSGYRLALVYNLLRLGKGRLPQPPDYAAQQAQATALLRGWRRESAAGEETPVKLIYPLEHAYTPAELGFGTLKGADSAVAAVLVEAARQADCDLYLALVSVTESGTAEYAGRGYWGRYDDEDFEAGEVMDVDRTVDEWRHPDGTRPPLGPLPFFPEELSPPDAFEGLEPDELEFQEATGNEGASFDRLYQRAALVLWPRAHRAVVLAQGGLAVTVPFLGELARQWQGSGAGRESPLWQEAHVLALQVQSDWPVTAWDRQRASEEGHAAEFLGHLVTLGDTQVLEAFLAEQTASGAYGKRDNEVLANALRQLPPARAGELITAIVKHNARARPATCADLLARAVGASADLIPELAPAARVLVETLPATRPGEPGDESDEALVYHDVEYPEAPTAGMVVALLPALAAIAPGLADQALAPLLAHPVAFDLDRVLVPAALQLNESAATRTLKCVNVLRGEVLAHLRRRIAEPLEPPADWRRPSAIACTCARCRELAHFLDDPQRESWRFKAAEADRRHVEASIHRHRCDVDTSTERRGRPYVLVCTKNQASYERRVRQRRQDLEHHAALNDETGAPGPAGR